jgi:hypothetical protein
MPLFNSTAEFIASFGGAQTLHEHGFIEPIALQDTKVGFSIKKKYPENIRYKPAIGQTSHEPDNIAAFWVIYEHPNETKNSPSEEKVPIRIRVANMSRYRIKHWDYDFDDKEGDSPSRASLEASMATPKPLDLEYPNEFFYDHIQNHFVNREGAQVRGFEILESVFQDHCKTVHLIWGLRLRAKLFAQDKFSGFLGALSKLLAFVLKFFFGRTLEDSDVMAGVLRPYKSDAMKKLNVDSIDLLGYRASKHVVIIFCVLVISLSIYRYFSGASEDYWSEVSNSEALSVVHGLFLLWFLDVVIPQLLFRTNNLLISFRRFVVLLKVKGP